MIKNPIVKLLYEADCGGVGDPTAFAKGYELKIETSQTSSLPFFQGSTIQPLPPNCFLNNLTPSRQGLR